MEKTGPVLYRVNVGVWKRHVDQMLTRPDPELHQTAVYLPVSPPVLLPQSDSRTTLHSNTPHQQKPDYQVPEPTKSPKDWAYR